MVFSHTADTFVSFTAYSWCLLFNYLLIHILTSFLNFPQILWIDSRWWVLLVFLSFFLSSFFFFNASNYSDTYSTLYLMTLTRAVEVRFCFLINFSWNYRSYPKWCVNVFPQRTFFFSQITMDKVLILKQSDTPAVHPGYNQLCASN